MRFLAAILWLALSGSAAAQGCGSTNPNCIVPTRPAGDNTGAAASTAFVETAIAGTAWTTYTPSPSCGTPTSATFTVNSARSKTIGKTTFIEADISISALNNCANVLSFTLPNTSNSNSVLAARDVTGSGGNAACEVISTAAICVVDFNMNGSSRLIVGGVYENQ